MAKKPKKYQCSQCEQDFQDGELVAVSHTGNEFYHQFYPERMEHPLDCMSKNVMNTGNMIIANRKIFYQGKFYDLKALKRLAKKVKTVTVGYNDTKTGDILEGDLSGLVKKSFFSQ